MTPEDEVSFLRAIERHRMEVYPRRVPEDWKTFIARAEEHARLPPEDFYLAAAELGPVEVDRVKRGPDKGYWRVDEVNSPVIFFQRSVVNEDGELVAGRLWAELDITPQTGRRDAGPDRFRRLYLEIEEWVKKTFRRGDPKDFYVGPKAARRAGEGLVLRSDERKGPTVRVHR